MCLETGSSIRVLALSLGFAVDGEKAAKAVPSPWKAGRAHTGGRGQPAPSRQHRGEQGVPAGQRGCRTRLHHHPLTATFVCLCRGESCPWAPRGPQLL